VSFLQSTHEKWEEWLERIGADLLDLAVCTHVYQELIRIVLVNPSLRGVRSSYWHFLSLTYTDYAVAAVRRQVKDQGDSISLARLLRELAEHPAAALRSGASQVDPAAVEADRSRLRSAVAEVEAVADRLVAHLDRRPPPERPQAPELYAAIEVLLEVFHRYRTLICDGPWDFNLTVSAGDWQELFKRPWIEERG
jgi:predicted nucleic acid-binding protein